MPLPFMSPASNRLFTIYGEQEACDDTVTTGGANNTAPNNRILEVGMRGEECMEEVGGGF